MENPAMLSDKMYNRLKWLVQIVLPATATFYFGVSQIYGLPGGEAVVGTIALLTTFLGVILGISSKQYNASTVADGELVSQTDSEGLKTYRLVLNRSVEELDTLQQVVFHVNRESS